MKREKFSMTRVHVNKNNGLDIEYTETTKEQEGEQQVSFICEHPGVRHPDFDKALNKLKIYLAKNYHVVDATEMLLSEIKQEIISVKDSTIVDRLKEIQKDLLSKITVTGISISGGEDFRGVIISGKIEGLSSNSAMNTTRIVFGQSTLGFEKEVEVLCNAVEDEVWEYLDNKKRSQLELEFTNTEPSENGHAKENGHSKKENTAQAKAKSKRGKKKGEEELVEVE